MSIETHCYDENIYSPLLTPEACYVSNTLKPRTSIDNDYPHAPHASWSA